MWRLLALITVMSVLSWSAASVFAAVGVYPSKDGTLVDDGNDGVVDDADWSFNQSGYEGVITLVTQPAIAATENRVVWEYDLSGVTIPTPVTATLRFIIRGAPVLPFPDVYITVFSYPADLVESEEDFSIGPVEDQGSVLVVPYQPPTPYELDVSSVINRALASGDDKAGFRFQVDPETPNSTNQAFIDASDSDPPSKPYLVIDQAPLTPGDLDHDGDVDLQDFATFALCFAAPVSNPPPGCSAQEAAESDMDGSGMIDLVDFATFAVNFTG
jgi:hypothetical protein